MIVGRSTCWCYNDEIPSARTVASPPGSCQRGTRSGWMGLTLRSSCGPVALGASLVVLAGRATTVPFIAVLIGPQRTTMDNATVTLTCAVPCRRR
jgi:hypothetical protein